MSSTPTTKPERRRSAESTRPEARAESIARYRLVRQLGEGGMGVVWVAHDPRLGRDVALKLMGGEGIGTEARARLAREARSMARVSHANVVQVFDAGTWEREGRPPKVFIAMELVDGEDLAAKLRRMHGTDAWKAGRCWAEIVALFVQAGEGLVAAHAAGLVHRDFKPPNVLVDAHGRARVGDFGLSRGDAEDDRRDLDAALVTEQGAASEGMGVMTKTGAVMGTPGYIAPEIFLGQRGDAKSDQWAFCVSLFEALHGKRPFRGASFPEVALATTDGKVQEVEGSPPVPPRLEAIVRRGLALDPDARFPNMRALVDALRAELDRPKVARRRLRLGAALLGAVAVGSASVAVWSTRSVAPCADAAAPLRSVWGPTDRAAVLAHVRALPAPFANRLADDVARAADRYATELASSYRGACEATYVHETQSESMLDRRVACLDRRLAELRALVREVGDADADAVERLGRALQLYPTFAACEDTAALATGVDPPPPTLEESVAAVRDRVATARASIAAGELAEAVSRGRDALREAEALPYPPIVVDAQLVLGEALAAAGRFDEASSSLRASFYASLATRDRERRFEAATALVDVDGVRRMELGVGDVWAEIALGTFASFDEERPVFQSRLENALAELRSAEGRRDEALEHAARAVALVERARGPEDLALLEPLRQLGDVRARLRDYVGAVEPLERARRIASTLPETHPERLSIDARYAAVLDGAGRRAEALPIARRTRDLAIESLPPAHPVLAFVRLKYADTLVHGGEVEAAVPEYEAALAATVAAYGESHTETARALLNLAGAEARLGRTDAAIERWNEALEMRERLLGRDHPDLAIVLQNIGSVQTERGRAREALGMLERAWAIRHERPASPMARADLDYWLGRALYESGEDPPRGRQLVVRAEETARREGYERPANDMRTWLDGHPPAAPAAHVSTERPRSSRTL
ncbi:MAG: serine/threonine protein kinase [Sandaracinus sp.]|nr:serine/threonine protein kinase [Sandaracinus sp.]MCB9632055.1 serine/threonine protein kinase [Sandaracinus sp.]